MRTLFTFILLFVLLVGGVLFMLFRYNDTAPPQVAEREESAPAIRYLALGDSYTIGQNVAENERWPNQLTTQLKANGVNISIVGNPSVTGYTTQDLIDRELPLLTTTNPNFVTIQIGVNDYVQGVSAAMFQNNFRTILSAVEEKVPKNRIVIITIPDYAKTPSGARYGDVAAATAAIKSFNDFIVQEAKTQGILSVDIYPISQGVVTDQSLTASDGLHPSGVQYKLWTNVIYQAITNMKTF